MAVSTQTAFVKRVPYTIGAGATVDVSTTPMVKLSSLKYILDAAIASATKYMAVEILVSKKGTDVTDTIYSKIGDPINLKINFLKIGSDAVLRVTNDELVTIEVRILQL